MTYMAEIKRNKNFKISDKRIGWKWRNKKDELEFEKIPEEARVTWLLKKGYISEKDLEPKFNS